MPLNRIYTPAGLLSQADKQSLARSFTQIYTDAGLPAFYVNVFFNEVPKESFFIGGESAAASSSQNAQAPRFIRIVFEHLARSLPDQAAVDRFLDRVQGILSSTLEGRNLSWEYHIIESDRNMWRIEGLIPPLPGSEAEKKWAAENKASPWQEQGAGAPQGRLAGSVALGMLGAEHGF